MCSHLIPADGTAPMNRTSLDETPIHHIGPLWAAMLAQPRLAVSRVRTDRSPIPALPGIYAWLHENTPVYSGRAGGRGGLRQRLRSHLGTDTDLSRSSLRRNVAEAQLGLPTALTRARPSRVTQDQADSVTAWLDQCQLTWLTYPDADAAKAAEAALHGEWLPPLSKR